MPTVRNTINLRSKFEAFYWCPLLKSLCHEITNSLGASDHFGLGSGFSTPPTSRRKRHLLYASDAGQERDARPTICRAFRIW